MRLCPTCNRYYPDDQLSFCLDDGTPLIPTSGASSSGSDPNATLVYGAPRPTEAATTPNTSGGRTAAPVNPSWNAAPEPAKKSNAVWWILGTIAVVVLGGGGISVALAVAGIVAFSGSSNSNAPRNRPNNANTSPSRKPIDTVNDDGRKVVLSDDFSEQKWIVNSGEIGTTEYVDGMYQISGITGRYYSAYGPSDEYKTDENTTASVTVQNVSGKSSTYGYGISVFGHVTNSQANDYAFLIFTGDRPQFRVVLHQNGEATTVKDWTDAKMIRTGTTPNYLKVKITSGQMSFYINGDLATSIPNSAGFTDGRVGLCTHDSFPVAFDQLLLER